MFRHAMHARARFGRLEVFPESDTSSSGWLSSSASSLASLRAVLNDETESWPRDCGKGRSDSTGSDFSVLMMNDEITAAVSHWTVGLFVFGREGQGALPNDVLDSEMVNESTWFTPCGRPRFRLLAACVGDVLYSLRLLCSLCALEVRLEAMSRPKRRRLNSQSIS